MLTKHVTQFQGVPKQVLDSLLPGGTKKPVSITMQPTVSKPSLSVKTLVEPVGKTEGKGDSFAKIAAIICEEVGSSPSDLKPDTAFASLGIDSLLALNVLSRLREELSLDLSPTIFLELETVSELRAFLGGTNGWRIPGWR